MLQGTPEFYKTEIKKIMDSGDMTDYYDQWDVYQLLLNAKQEVGLEDRAFRDWCMKVSKYAHEMADYMRPDDMSGKENELYWDFLLFEARNHQVDSGLLYLEKNRIPKERFYDPRRDVFMKHRIVQSLQDIIDDNLDILVVALPPGTGKLLADDTPVLTESGWKNHGDLVPGDMVYGIDGKLKRVLHVFPKDSADCLVTFTNGEQIQCHENHEWPVFDRLCCENKIVSTKELIDRLSGNEKMDLRYQIARKKPPETDTVRVDRYVYVEKVERVSPKPGNCIQVEGGIYCAGKAMIPTHNSTIEVFFLSLVGGWYPNDFNLSSAHSSILTRSLYDGVSEIIDDPVEYTWHEIFPGIRKQATNAKETTINLERAGRFKTWTFRSIDGSLTGATRCNRILTADDLVSGIEEALNKSRLDTLWTKVVNDLFSRMLDGCKRILFNTRWSVHDPSGRLERMLAGNPRARFISVPALDENGESNFRYKINGFSREYFEQQRDFMDDISFNCLYQQKAVEREGLLLPAEELRRFYWNKDQVPEDVSQFTIIPDREPDAVWAICDTKDKGIDFESLPIIFQYSDDFFIIDVLFDNTTDYDLLDNRTAEILIKHNPHKARFEANNAGGRVAYDVGKLIKGKCSTEIETKPTSQNKETKILANSGWIKAHMLFLGPSLYTPKSDYGLFVGNVVTYTTKAKVTNDDGIDSLAMFSEWVREMFGFDAKPTRIIDSPI